MMLDTRGRAAATSYSLTADCCCCSSSIRGESRQKTRRMSMPVKRLTSGVGCRSGRSVLTRRWRARSARRMRHPRALGSRMRPLLRIHLSLVNRPRRCCSWCFVVVTFRQACNYVTQCWMSVQGLQMGVRSKGSKDAKRLTLCSKRLRKSSCGECIQYKGRSGGARKEDGGCVLLTSVENGR
jgi:hypothetical protein